MRFAVCGAALCAMGLVSSAACKTRHDSAPDVDASGLKTPLTVASAIAPKPLPDEPRPPFPDTDAAVLSEASERLAKNPALAGIWEEGKHEQLEELLTCLSTALETLDSQGKTQIHSLDKLQKWKLETALYDLGQHVVSRGELPGTFVASLRRELTSRKASKNLGVWQAPAKPHGSWFDFSALAAWLNREDPSYLREHLAARGKLGTLPWPRIAKPLRPWLAREADALAWLGKQLVRQGKLLEPEEKSRLMELFSSPLGVESPEEVSLLELLKEYRSNEVRADGRFRGHVIEVSGTAEEIRKNALDHVYVAITAAEHTGATNLHCQLSAKYESAISHYDKGDQITVRGRVKGMVLTSVMLDACEPVEN